MEAEQTFANRLRELADWLEVHPEYPEPESISKETVRFDFGYSHEPAERLGYFVGLFGLADKDSDNYFFTLTKRARIAGFTFMTRTSKSNVCEKREYEEREEGEGYTITRQVVEHKCHHSILAGATP